MDTTTTVEEVELSSSNSDRPPCAFENVYIPFYNNIGCLTRAGFAAFWDVDEILPNCVWIGDDRTERLEWGNSSVTQIGSVTVHHQQWYDCNFDSSEPSRQPRPTKDAKYQSYRDYKFNNTVYADVEAAVVKHTKTNCNFSSSRHGRFLIQPHEVHPEWISLLAKVHDGWTIEASANETPSFLARRQRDVENLKALIELWKMNRRMKDKIQVLVEKARDPTDAQSNLFKVILHPVSISLAPVLVLVPPEKIRPTPNAEPQEPKPTAEASEENAPEAAKADQTAPSGTRLACWKLTTQ